MKTYWVHQDDPIDGLDDIPVIWEGKMIEMAKAADVQAECRKLGYESLDELCDAYVGVFNELAALREQQALGHKAQLAQAHEAYRVVNEARVLVEQQYTALEQERGRLVKENQALEDQNDKLGDELAQADERLITIYEALGDVRDMREQLATLTEAVKALPKVEGEIIVSQPPHSFYHVVQQELSECGAFLSREHAEAYAALLRLRQEMTT